MHHFHLFDIPLKSYHEKHWKLPTTCHHHLTWIDEEEDEDSELPLPLPFCSMASILLRMSMACCIFCWVCCCCSFCLKLRQKGTWHLDSLQCLAWYQQRANSCLHTGQLLVCLRLQSFVWFMTLFIFWQLAKRQFASRQVQAWSSDWMHFCMECLRAWNTHSHLTTNQIK